MKNKKDVYMKIMRLECGSIRKVLKIDQKKKEKRKNKIRKK